MKRGQVKTTEDPDGQGDSCPRLDFLRDVAIQQLALLNSQVPEPLQPEVHSNKLRNENILERVNRDEDNEQKFPLNPNMANSLIRHVDLTTNDKDGAHKYSANHDKSDSSDSEKKTLRKGKWTREEEEYANTIIKYYSSGHLHMPYGESLRSYLSKRLNCDGMRITKKFANTTNLAQRSYSIVGRDISNAELEHARNELNRLEMRFRRRIFNPIDHDEMSESERTVTSELPSNNYSASAVQIPPIDSDTLARTTGMVNPLLASILLQQLLSKNTLQSCDSATTNRGFGLNTINDDLISSLSTCISASSNQPVSTFEHQTSPIYADINQNLSQNHNTLRSEQILSDHFNQQSSGLASSFGDIFQYAALNSPRLQSQAPEMPQSTIITLQDLISRFRYQDELNKLASLKEAYLHRNMHYTPGTTIPVDPCTKSIEDQIVHMNEFLPDAQPNKIVDNNVNDTNVQADIIAQSKDTKAATTLVPTDRIIKTIREEVKEAPNTSETSSILTALNHDSSVDQRVNNKASQTLLGFLSELRKNHEAAMEQSFGQAQVTNAAIVDPVNQPQVTSFIQDEVQQRSIPVRTVSGIFSLSNQSDLDQSQASTYQQSVIPQTWDQNLKYTRIRDLDAVSSISGDTRSSNGRGKTGSGGATNETLETESNSSSEGIASLTDGHYMGSSNTSGNNSSDDELGNTQPYSDEKYGYILTGPFRKRLKHFKEATDRSCD